VVDDARMPRGLVRACAISSIWQALFATTSSITIATFTFGAFFMHLVAQSP